MRPLLLGATCALTSLCCLSLDTQKRQGHNSSCDKEESHAHVEFVSEKQRVAAFSDPIT